MVYACARHTPHEDQILAYVPQKMYSFNNNSISMWVEKNRPVLVLLVSPLCSRAMWCVFSERGKGRGKKWGGGRGKGVQTSSSLISNPNPSKITSLQGAAP